MKKSILFLMIIFCMVGYAQENYAWSSIDSISKSKDLLYKDTKVFIAKTWNSSKDVIQIDDKEAGHLMLKSVSIQPVINGGVHIGDVYYIYYVNFYFKENKWKITINDVSFDKQTIGAGWDKYLNKLPQKEYPGMTESGLSKNSYLKIYNGLNDQLQSIIDLYISEIKKESTTNDNW